MIEYWFDRFVFSPFVPAGLLLAFATAWTSAGTPIEIVLAWIVLLPVVLLALAQFRLWDDLADRERDRRAHPERILCIAPIGPFLAYAALLPIVKLCAASLLVVRPMLALLAALDVAVLGYYALRPTRRTALSDALLLAKYPLLVVALAFPAGRPAPLLVAAVATYAAAFAYELWHDPAGPLRANS